MAKVRKTKEQKKLADLRHQTQHKTISYTFEKKHLTAPKTNIINTNTLNAYPFLIKDLRKTIIVTSIIISLQIAIFILLKFQFIKIPGLVY